MSDIAQEQTREAVDVALAAVVEDVAAVAAHDDGNVHGLTDLRKTQPEVFPREVLESFRCRGQACHGFSSAHEFIE